MSIYEKMPLDELIKCYENFAAMPQVEKYLEISDELFSRSNKDFQAKPQREEYKRGESGTVYFLELPYDQLSVGYKSAWVKKHSYSYCYEKPNGSTAYSCSSLCGYSREKVIEMLERAIEENERELMANE